MAKKKKETAEGAEGATEAKGGSKKLIIIALVVGVGGLFAGKMLFGGATVQGGTSIVIEGAETTAPVKRLEAVSIPLDAVIVNLAGGGFLKVNLTVMVLPDHSAAGGGHAPVEVDVDAMKPKLSKIPEEALAFLSGKSSAEVLSANFQSEFKAHLIERSELWYEHSVGDVVITGWVATS